MGQNVYCASLTSFESIYLIHMPFEAGGKDRQRVHGHCHLCRHWEGGRSSSYTCHFFGGKLPFACLDVILDPGRLRAMFCSPRKCRGVCISQCLTVHWRMEKCKFRVSRCRSGLEHVHKK